MKSTTAGDYVTVTATLTSNNTNAASLLKWTGGTAVTGQPLQRHVPKNKSTNIVVTATCGNTSSNASVWIIWATISYQFTNANPSPLLFSFYGQFPDETLGVEFFSGAYYGKMCATATVTPTGIHNIIPSGWVFRQFKNEDAYENGVLDEAKSTSEIDSTPSTPSVNTINPAIPAIDSNDKIYLIDSPSLPQLNGLSSEETYQNFKDYIMYNGAPCSDTTYSWHWFARQKTSSVDLKDLGPDNLKFPTKTFYPQ